MNHCRRNLLFASLLIVAAAAGAPAQEPNSRPAMSGASVALPADLFVAAAGDSATGCFNIRHAPFGAKGDGVTDDSEAFIRAWEFIQRRNAKFNNTHESRG